MFYYLFLNNSTRYCTYSFKARWKNQFAARLLGMLLDESY